jgi:hypothetical protein
MGTDYSKSKQFRNTVSIAMLSNGAMRSFPGTGGWTLATDREAAALRARRHKQSRVRERRAIMMRVAIACTAFALLVALGWYIGTQAPHASEQQETTAAKVAAKRVGRIVFELPDGTNCRYVDFDNTTGRTGAEATAVCEDVDRKRPAQPTTAFSWGRP